MTDDATDTDTEQRGPCETKVGPPIANDKVTPQLCAQCAPLRTFWKGECKLP